MFYSIEGKLAQLQCYAARYRFRLFGSPDCPHASFANDLDQRVTIRDDRADGLGFSLAVIMGIARHRRRTLPIF